MKWKLNIRNFGKIKSAEIHDSSLRLIVGPNNSGKSYLMTLLWGMERIATYGLNTLEQDVDLSSWISAEKYHQIYHDAQQDFFF